jgi:hypothetical protein
MPNVVPTTANNDAYVVRLTAVPSHISHPAGALTVGQVIISPGIRIPLMASTIAFQSPGATICPSEM